MSKNEEMKESAGTKYDAGKLRLDLIDPEFEAGIAEVLGFGAQKYDEYNWVKGFQWTRLYGAIRRHLKDAMYKSMTDSESGLLALDHAACMLMFLRRHMTDSRYAHLDDRCKVLTDTNAPLNPVVGLDPLEDWPFPPLEELHKRACRNCEFKSTRKDDEPCESCLIYGKEVTEED